MSYNSNTKTITAPVSVYDVQQALNTSENDVGRLCTHQNINMWAKCKPIDASSIAPLDYDHAAQANKHFGLEPVYQSGNYFAQFLTKVYNALTDNNYKIGNSCVMCKYLRPNGGLASPYRLSDFDRYDHDANLSYATDNTSIERTYLYEYGTDIIDLTNPQDKTLHDDTAELNYYESWMSHGDEISVLSRPLHVLDILKFCLDNGITINSGFKRGIIFFPHYGGVPNKDSAKYVYGTSNSNATIPWNSDPEWLSTLASPEGDGQKATIVEFYYNTNTAGNGFYAIPGMCYEMHLKSKFQFMASAIGGNNPDYISINISSFKGSIDTFENLWLGLEICVPTTNSTTGNIEYVNWERINVSTGDAPAGSSYNGWITIRYYGNTRALAPNTGNVVGTYEYNLDGISGVEGVTRKDVAQSGTMVRAVLYGSLTNTPNNWEYFYRSPEDNWFTI